MWVDFLRWAHVIGATVLLGTGAGIAFFMVMAHRTRDTKIIAHTGKYVVIADWVFTTSAVIIQPITGILLARKIGWPLLEGWVLWSLLLYVLVGVFWLPVVWIQHQLRNIAKTADENAEALPERYFRLYRIWFMSGFPAFFAVLAIVWLMVSRPVV
ncbi:DUF2269 family protein [Robiginitomaculum antarcticum]|uniref:DUF2269 family protein n=1 Tax=Robiginitomaculum antarcticum TaxID=437507 RepID=UPI0003698D55|nr:DUF2269 domain-containing protein [Robiginitomaculum antarcticum]